MNAQRSIFKWVGVIFLFVILMSFAFFLPSASAQEGIPSTATLVESLATPEPMVIPELEQEVGAQILSQSQPRSWKMIRSCRQPPESWMISIEQMANLAAIGAVPPLCSALPPIS